MAGEEHLVYIFIKNNLSILIHFITSSLSVQDTVIHSPFSLSIEKHSLGLKTFAIITIFRTLLQH